MNTEEEKEEAFSAIDKMLDDLNDHAEVELLAHDRAVGFDIRWTMKGFGFGQLLLYYSSKKQGWVADTERMSQESVEKILVLAAPALAKKMLELDP